VLVNAITPTALRLCPALCLARREADAFCDALADVLGQVLAASHA
jgi:4-aminobutyrate aminotransferase-like enzyme